MAKNYLVKNRSAGEVYYSIPELNIHRQFAPGEVKKIDYIELEKLNYIQGGAYLLANYLQVEDEQLIEDLEIPTQPEYVLDEKQIVELLQQGSLEQFLDCLDFAPDGVLSLIKDYSVKLPLNDMAKIKAIKDKLGYDVMRAIENSKVDAPIIKKENTAASASSGRRTAVNYKNVVLKK